ncbi:O-methyltransferase [Bacillus sp. B15-48]|uniref:O-methyltransferase n=1 Tax=Bacillus sp. B15-48 TaxID=1548601 RepID=UPI00193F1BFA|nr:O-methyltransferase [Bacillus sp. B15-48]MBM4762381.1 methyltransferase domain-containing protein [Bacillus sp. B15-48]
MLVGPVHEYIDSLIPASTGIFAEIETYAMKHNVPIMEREGIEAMLQLLRIKKPERILEIGTAIGYSALRIAHALPQVRIVTIERDEDRLNMAKNYIEKADKSAQIVTILGDALETESQIKQYGLFDTVFIDAAKGQYRRFFEIYSKMLAPGGVIVTDNVLYKGLVAETAVENKRTRNLVKKIDDFNKWLMNHPEFHTTILPVGDGVAISMKR